MPLPRRPARAAWLVAALLALAQPARADVVPLPDSTSYHAARMPNGMSVLLRHVPNAGSVTVAVAYPVGTDHDPPGEEGLAELLAEVVFTAAAGEAPARSRAELDGIRPLGWSVEVGRRFTRFAESARPEQVPGIIHQMAERMRGVTITREDLEAASRNVRRELAESYRNRLDAALHNHVRDAAGGRSLGETERYASGEGIARIGLEAVRKYAKERFVPSQAALAIVGDLGSTPIQAIVLQELGQIPVGRPPGLPLRSLRPAVRVVSRPGLAEPAGAVGILAPALTDSLHPSFYYHAVVFGTMLNRAWGRDSLLTSRFKYAITDDPEFARFYPPARLTGSDSTGAGKAFTSSVSDLLPTLLGTPDYVRIISGMMWLIGGPMEADILARVRRDPAWSRTLANGTATRLLWGDEEFWDRYRMRLLEATDPNFAPWQVYFGAPQRQAQVMLLPAGKRPR